MEGSQVMVFCIRGDPAFVSMYSEFVRFPSYIPAVVVSEGFAVVMVSPSIQAVPSVLPVPAGASMLMVFVPPDPVAEYWKLPAILYQPASFTGVDVTGVDMFAWLLYHVSKQFVELQDPGCM